LNRYPLEKKKKTANTRTNNVKKNKVRNNQIEQTAEVKCHLKHSKRRILLFTNLILRPLVTSNERCQSISTLISKPNHHKTKETMKDKQEKGINNKRL